MTREEFLAGEPFRYRNEETAYAYREHDGIASIITIADGKEFCKVAVVMPTVAMITLPLFGHGALRYGNLQPATINQANYETAGN